MPTFYGPRKTNRGQWSQMDLDRAVKAVRVDKLSIRRAARENHIPEKTLHRRLATGKFTKGSLGKSSYLGPEAEAKLVAHVQKLQSLGFSPTRQTLRHLAYNLSQLMGLKGPFSEKKKIAGTYWYMLFMKRNPTLHVRKADSCISMARNQGMDKRVVNEFFKLLTKTFTQNELLNKPGNIFTMDESFLQLQGETITVIACCSAEGNFIPPYCIVKGADNAFLKECLPPESVVKINSESADCTTELFMNWFENHFVVWKPVGKCVLIMDDSPSHMNSVDMLEIAMKHNIILQCLPRFTLHYLQPLRSFFKLLKIAYRNACQKFIKDQSSVKNIELRNLGVLFSSAWVGTANIKNATAGLSCSGIWPLQPSAIPESAYLVTSQSTSSTITETLEAETPTSSLALMLPDETQSALFDSEQETNVLEADNVLLDIKEEEVTIEEMNLEDVLNRNFPKVESSSDDDSKVDQEESLTSQQAVSHTSGDKTMDTYKFRNKRRKLSEKENLAEENQNFRNNVQVKIENEDNHIIDYGFHVANRLQNSNQSDRAIEIAKQKIDEILRDLERGAFESSY